MGALYKRKNVWWVKYYVAGRPIRESTRTTKQKEAKRYLKEREGRVAAGMPVLPRADRVLYDEIAEDLRRHYATSGERDLDEADDRLKPLGQFFKDRRVVAIDGVLAEQFVQARQANGVANSTINRELAMLTKMLRFAYENGKLLRLPVIRKLKEPPPRKGFLEREVYEVVRRRLPSDLQVAVTLAHTYGWRMQSEVLTLALSQMDLEAGTLRLEPGTTKNDEGRVVYLTPELKAMLGAQVERVRELERQLHRIIPYLFPHLGKRLQGQRIKDFRYAWRTACRKSGVPGMLRHDFRRTAVRNMVNKGVPERVAMTVTGHRSRSVFDRYHIVSPGDLQEVARKLAGTIWAQSPHAAVDSIR
jgi:integrase